jgi:hypothetical protein
MGTPMLVMALKDHLISLNKIIFSLEILSLYQELMFNLDHLYTKESEMKQITQSNLFDNNHLKY